MTNPKIIPLIVQKLLDEDLDKGLPHQDCEDCGGINTVTFEEDHLYYNDTDKIEIVVPAFVCNVCSNEFYPVDSYQRIIQHLEVSKGKPYIKVEIKDGKVLKYAIH